MAEREEPAVRASDAERDEVAGALAQACAEGRLSPDELESRVQRAYAAAGRDELDALLADLPTKAPRAAAARRGRKRHFAPGIVAFSERADVGSSPEAAFDAALTTLVPGLGRAGYHVMATERPTLIRLERKRRLAAPHPLTIVFTRAPRGGTRIAGFGEAPRGIRKAFAELGT